MTGGEATLHDPVAPAGSGTSRCEVIVLSSLHQLHERVPGYGYAELARVVECLRPDVLALELSPEDLAARMPQSIKREYQFSVYPLLDRLGSVCLPLEPPQHNPMIDRARAARRLFHPDTHPSAALFATYVEHLFAWLLENWLSPADVNSAQTDALLAVKHRFQEAIAPAEEAASWEEWNQHFLARILEAAHAHPGQRVVAIVGVEHAYWLRQRLRLHPGLALLDTELLLRTECENQP
ncbi:MAG: hypothetical protein LH617_04065 [Ramlibacter sp.]|nr:hypothetical protein [Ramlibacter sp.]